MRKTKTIPFQAPPADDQEEENSDENVSEDEIEEEPENIATSEVENYVPSGQILSIFILYYFHKQLLHK